MRVAAFCIVLFAAFLSDSRLALAGQQTAAAVGRIEGVVSTELGSALGGAAIVVRDARGRIAARRTSDESGRFSVDGVPAGDYRVVVSLRDFITAERNVVVTDSPATDLIVTLSPASEALTIVASTEVLTTGNALAADNAMASRELDQFVPGTGFQSAVRMFASVMATPNVGNNRGQLFSFRIDEFRPRFATGGPLVAGRLFLEQTGQVRFSSSDVPSRPENERRVSKSLSSFTRLDANISPRRSLVATVGLFPGVTASAKLGTVTPPEATVDLHAFVKQAAVTEREVWTSAVVSETTVHALQSSTNVFPQGTALMELRPETTLGNFFNRQHRNSASLQVVETVTV